MGTIDVINSPPATPFSNLVASAAAGMGDSKTTPDTVTLRRGGFQTRLGRITGIPFRIHGLAQPQQGNSEFWSERNDLPH